MIEGDDSNRTTFATSTTSYIRPPLFRPIVGHYKVGDHVFFNFYSKPNWIRRMCVKFFIGWDWVEITDPEEIKQYYINIFKSFEFIFLMILFVSCLGFIFYIYNQELVHHIWQSLLKVFNTVISYLPEMLRIK